MGVRALAAAALAAAALAVPAYAAGGTMTDPCGDGSPAAADVARADVVYSATSLQVRPETCAFADVDGDWTMTIHLTSFTPEVQIVGAMTDVGKFSLWSGFYLCDQVTCPVDTQTFPHRPAGIRLAGSDWFDNLDHPALSGRSAYAYGDWSALLPSVTIPSTIDFYVTTHQGNADVDRAPNAGTVTSTMLTSARDSVVVPNAVPRVRFGTGAPSPVTGTLHYGTATGTVLPNRWATLYTTGGARYDSQFYGGADYGADVDPYAGEFETSVVVPSNTTFKVGFDGDGVTNPSARPTVRALVDAFVSLDLPASMTWPRGRGVRFHGVVRPRQLGSSVLVQARSGPPGTAWRNWRTVPLLDNADTYFSFTWTPSNTGTTTFRVLWLDGSSAEGDVMNGMSNYATITVTS